ncbi:hypothetical protein JMJ35_007003 [Cladonia borealis]|uniref:BZIP domain-containing protein n=1 Tax=Cladonia borealis TaxID=184061 RepID=A0AA39QY37_9LECA|nr:hypothetical protein JMJ35_007003 [Cladonia borealis]
MHPYTVAPSPGGLVSSPNATVFPQVLTPATSSTVNKPLAPMPGMGNQPPISINKQWVLPPKPKPGRKPAIDTPPTKRKAQNREAQRAFRERRAAKVGELEEEMRRMEEEDRKEQEELRGRIKQLENDVDQYSHMVMKWQERYREREMECERERQSRKFLENEVELLRKGMVDGTDAVPLPPRPTQQGYAGNQSTKKQDATDHTCGNCDGDYCKCVDDALKASAYSAEDATAATFKRPHSPPSSTDNKRSRHASDLDNNTEIDFTYQFATPSRPTLSTSASTVSIAAVAPPDPCGFCDDGTACLCAEMAKDKAFSDDLKPPPPSLPLPIQKPTNTAAKPDPCINGPGTCKQCLSSPLSTLFCKSVAAANRTSLASDPNKPTSLPQTATTDTNTPTTTTTEPTLTCADAFTTLSRHPAFDLASNELGTWVPQLAAGRRPAMWSRPDRTAYEIEAASVMSVLRFFDRRFGGDGQRVDGNSAEEETAKNGIAYESGQGQ